MMRKQSLVAILLSFRLPKSTDTVHKEECVFSFDDAFTKDEGLYINLSTFVGPEEFLGLT